jgi:hypothetical protein
VLGGAAVVAGAAVVDAGGEAGSGFTEDGPEVMVLVALELPVSTGIESSGPSAVQAMNKGKATATKRVDIVILL